MAAVVVVGGSWLLMVQSRWMGLLGLVVASAGDADADAGAVSDLLPSEALFDSICDGVGKGGVSGCCDAGECGETVGAVVRLPASQQPQNLKGLF